MFFRRPLVLGAEINPMKQVPAIAHGDLTLFERCNSYLESVQLYSLFGQSVKAISIFQFLLKLAEDWFES